MKLKTRLALFFFAISISLSHCQVEGISVQKGTINKDEKKNTELLFTVDDGNGGVIIIRQFLAGLLNLPEGYYIEYYNSNLDLVNSYEMQNENSGIKNVLIDDGKLFLIEYRKNKETNSNDYNLLTASLSDFEFSSKNLFSISRKDVKKPFAFSIGLLPFTNLSSIDHDPTGEVKFSENKEFLAFNFDLKNDKEETHRVIIYNRNFELVYDKVVTEAISDRYFRYNSFTVDNTDGSVYFLGKAYQNEKLKNKHRGEINYKFNIYKITSEGSNKLVFDSKDHFISSLEILNKNEKIFCIGSYSDKNANRNLGIVYFNLDKYDLKIKNTTYNPFTEEFLTDKYGEKKGKRKKDKNKELSNFTFKDYYLDKDNNLYFNAEEFFITQRTVTSSNGNMKTRTYYHYNDIYVCKINREGELLWLRTINKSQVTRAPRGYLSFSSSVVDDRMILLLNGSENVQKLKDDRIAFRQSKKSKLNLYAITVGADGSFDYEIISPEDKTDITYKTRYGVTSEDKKSIVLEGNDKKHKQIIKVNF